MKKLNGAEQKQNFETLILCVLFLISTSHKKVIFFLNPEKEKCVGIL